MNIAPISYNCNRIFGAKEKARIHLKDGTTALLTVEGNPKTACIKHISGDIMSKGKVVGKVEEFHSKKPYNDEDFAVFCETLGKKAKEPDSVFDRIYDAIMHPNFTYNG